jgi:hypothetical protein
MRVEGARRLGEQLAAVDQPPADEAALRDPLTMKLPSTVLPPPVASWTSADLLAFAERGAAAFDDRGLIGPKLRSRGRRQRRW